MLCFFPIFEKEIGYDPIFLNVPVCLGNISVFYVLLRIQLTWPCHIKT